MKRASLPFLLLLVLCLLTAAWPARAEEPQWVDPRVSADASPYDEEHPELLEPDQLIAHSAVLLEADSGQIIFEKNAFDLMYPASTTKIMTLLLGILTMDESELDQTVTVSETAMDIPADSSTMGLHVGEEVIYRNVLYGTMMLSGNDGANVIAETVSGSIGNFVNLMNTAAASFGCTSTHFVNAHGYHDPYHYTTAYDMALITREAMKNELFRQIVSTTSYDMPRTSASRARTITTRSTILIPPTEENANKYYYEGATGVKTGFHNAAGYCYVGSASRDGVNLISVVFYTANRGRWTDTKKLFDYGFSQYESVTPIDLYNMNPITIETTNYSLKDANMGKVPLTCVAAGDVSGGRITATRNEIEAMATNLRRTVLISWTRDFAAPVEAGETMGTLTWYDETGKEYVYNLIASRSVNRRENAPKTIEQIYAEADADPNPLPPFSLELLILFLLPFILLGVVFLLLRFLIRRIRRRNARVPRPKSRYLK